MRSILRLAYRMAAAVLAGTNIERFGPVKRLNHFITSRIGQRVVEIDGVTYHLDARDSLNLSILREFEPVETALMRQEIKEGDVVVDIGANIGYFTLLFSELVGESGTVYAFEPDAHNFALLEKNIDANGRTNIRPICKAVSETTGTSRLFLSSEGGVDHRMYDSGDGREHIDIETVSLDEYLDPGLKVDFIKMDTQGSEVLATTGMQDVLNRSANVKLLTEFWPVGLHRSGTTAENYIQLLHDSQFTLHDYAEKTRSWEPARQADLLAAHTVENETFTNLLCRKQNK